MPAVSEDGASFRVRQMKQAVLDLDQAIIVERNSSSRTDQRKVSSSTNGETTRAKAARTNSSGRTKRKERRIESSTFLRQSSQPLICRGECAKNLPDD